jgi:leader peptidase (prepilin peptidase)/N-methyltransferase
MLWVDLEKHDGANLPASKQVRDSLRAKALCYFRSQVRRPMTLAEAYAFFPSWLLRGAVIFFGLIWGSFLNVVIYRVPREMSVVRPGSHCPGCGKPIAGYDNIPVFTYVLLRGRARCCGAKMSPRYPLVELLGGVLSLGILEVIIFKMPESTPAVRALAVYGADFALCMGLVAAAFIDAEHMFLPDSITIGGTLVGIVTATPRGLPFTSALIGAVAGFVGVWLPFNFLYKRVLGRTGMGLGDAKLLALAGAWFGWQGAVFVLFAGALQGSLYALTLFILGIKPGLPQSVLDEVAELEKLAAEGDEEAKKELEEDPLAEQAGPRLPFGPFLILACLELLFASEWITARLAPFLGPL